MSPDEPVIEAYSAVACDLTVVMRASRSWIELASVLACSTSAWRVARFSGLLATADQLDQNLSSCAEMPFWPGSERPVSTWPIADEVVWYSPRRSDCARYCRSRKPSRMRRK